ncbi:MAG: PIN domain-containing protein [Elusimicrobia bacterium]|nr:PIN domain-containing protein [Elusimicrobiota bacterium]
MAVLTDTGFLFALLDKDDLHHKESADLLKSAGESFVVPFVVLPEVCYLAQKYLGPEAEASFLAGLLRGELALDWPVPADLKRAAEIMRSRPDFGLVDAAVMAAAERLRITRIATFDHRHFGSFVPARGKPFELLP